MEPTKDTPASPSAPPPLSPPPTPRRRSKRPFVILGTIAASAVAVYLLYGWYTKFTGTTPNTTRAGSYSVTVSTAGQIITQNLTASTW